MARALIFDSGVGGLSVVSEIRSAVPGLHLTYAADDAFRPYGDKTEAQLRARLPGLVAPLAEAACADIIVIACNTASVTALPSIRAAVSVPVVGVVPAIKPAAKLSRTKTVGVLGTPGTVARDYVGGLIDEFASDCTVILQGSVALVELAERKLVGEAINPAVVTRELKTLLAGQSGADIDVVVLACTHFPLIKDELQAAVTQTVHWVDSGSAIAARVADLTHHMPATPKSDETALLVGPAPSAARRAVFARYGFNRIVALQP